MMTSIQFHYDPSLNKWKVFVTGAKTTDEAKSGFFMLRDMFESREFPEVTVKDIGHGLFEIMEENNNG